MILDPRQLLDLDIVGVPYKKDGRDPADSVDCYGLVRWAVAHRGIDLPPDSTEMISIMKHRRMGRLLKWPCKTEPWDVLLMAKPIDPEMDFITHVALVVDNENALHAESQAGGVVLTRISRCEPSIRRVVRFYLPDLP